ncbi:unnamed protein product [Parnassius apollo]|uniref:(apollo) hypothetical protein n=1 Tax=Parnassius apollo TaxID=110799 RepID=A0A8S3Y646_PARAO|nr:unnamed protein product [Parnassius apollo]
MVSAGSSRTQQAAPAAGGATSHALVTNNERKRTAGYFRAKGEETGCLARLHRLFAELEPSLTVTEQNLADRVRYILRSNIFDVAELERLRREAVPSSDENATAEDAAPQIVEQPANVDAAVNTPVVVDSNDDGTVAQELELEIFEDSLEEAIVETVRKSTATSAHSPKQAESGCREGSEPNDAVEPIWKPAGTFTRRTQFFLAPRWQSALS